MEAIWQYLCEFQDEGVRDYLAEHEFVLTVEEEEAIEMEDGDDLLSGNIGGMVNL